MRDTIAKLFLVFICFSILILSVRGIPGNPTKEDFLDNKWIEEGPFELSPERARFALTFSLIEDKSTSLNPDVARFALPDLGFAGGKYVSLFAPATSFIVIPGYLLGKSLGASQVGAYFVVSFIASLNVILIYQLSRRVGAGIIPAVTSSLVFLFATPAFSYATSLYQHHISTFLILLGVYILNFDRFWALVVAWTLYGISISVDYPNAIIMAPIAFLALTKSVKLVKKDYSINVKLQIKKLISAFALTLPLLFFFWYNHITYGSFVKLAGEVEDVYGINQYGTPILVKEESQDFEAVDAPRRKTAINFFNTRNLVSGMIVHFLSPDRGVVFFAPVVLFAFIGIPLLKRGSASDFTLLASVAGIDIALYSMWGDPWGGWAFGSRYLIPFYAMAAIILSVAIEKFKKSDGFVFLFSIVAIYSVLVNTLGAVTTSSNPPKKEAEALSNKYATEFKYTIERNLDYLLDEGSKSFVYQRYAKNYIEAWKYYLTISLLIIIPLTSNLIYLYAYQEFVFGKLLSEKLKGFVENFGGKIRSIKTIKPLSRYYS